MERPRARTYQHHLRVRPSLELPKGLWLLAFGIPHWYVNPPSHSHRFEVGFGKRIFHRRVAQTINAATNLGGPHVGFTCGAFDFAFSFLSSNHRNRLTRLRYHPGERGKRRFCLSFLPTGAPHRTSLQPSIVTQTLSTAHCTVNSTPLFSSLCKIVRTNMPTRKY